MTRAGNSVETRLIAEHAAENVVRGAVFHEQHHHVLDLVLRKLGVCAVRSGRNAGLREELLRLGKAAADDVLLEAPAMTQRLAMADCSEHGCPHAPGRQ